MRKKKKKTDPEELLVAIAEAVDDGFCPVSSLVSRFPKLSHRELVRLRGQALRRGLLLERRGADGQVYLALTSERLATGCFAGKARRAAQGRDHPSSPVASSIGAPTGFDSGEPR